MVVLLAKTVALKRLSVFTTDWQTWMKVLSLEALSRTARQACLGPIRGTGAGVAYHNPRLEPLPSGTRPRASF